MKRIITLFAFVLGLTGAVLAQSGERLMLWDDLHEGTIVLKSGGQMKVYLNYHFGENSFVFTDDKNGPELNVLDKMQAVTVLAGEKTFIFNADGVAMEVLSADPLLVVSFTGQMKDQNSSAAYGGTSQTSSVTNLSSLHHMNYVVPNMQYDSQYAISGIRYSYKLQKDGKESSFASVKQLVRIYPKQHRDAMNEYIKENGVYVDFPESVLRLVKFAESLE